MCGGCIIVIIIIIMLDKLELTIWHMSDVTKQLAPITQCDAAKPNPAPFSFTTNINIFQKYKKLPLTSTPP